MLPDDLTELTRRPPPGDHRVTIDVAGEHVETLADLPPLRDRLLFVGLNPSPVSVAAGHYHQGRLGRTFWRRLMTAGVLPASTDIETADDALMAVGHGITDLLKVPTPRDEASDADLTAGVGPLWQKIAIWRPAAIVFIYKRAASISAGRDLAEPWGHMPGVALAGRPCVLMPGPYAPVEQVDEGLNFVRNLVAALPIDRG
jgi:TDG/mug DNA glycosylase family protein